MLEDRSLRFSTFEWDDQKRAGAKRFSRQALHFTAKDYVDPFAFEVLRFAIMDHLHDQAREKKKKRKCVKNEE